MVSLAWVSDTCSLGPCTFSCLSCSLWQHQHPRYNWNNNELWLHDIKTLFSDPCRDLFEESLKYVPSLLVQIDREQQNLHSWQNALSLLKEIFIYFISSFLVFMISPDAAFIHSSSFSALLCKVTVLLFLTVLVTLVSIILLSPVTTVIASLPHQIGEKGFRFLQEIHSFLSHLVIYSEPVPTTFFINKTTGGFPSVVAVQQLSNLWVLSYSNNNIE